MMVGWEGGLGLLSALAWGSEVGGWRSGYGGGSYGSGYGGVFRLQWRWVGAGGREAVLEGLQ